MTVHSMFASWDQDIYGIYDVKEKAWTLDCFDDPRVWPSRKDAEEYYELCKDYAKEPGRFEIRVWRIGRDQVSQG